MDEMRIADGFDAPERLLLGLGLTQLLALLASLLVGYALLRSTLPGAIALPLALSVVAAGAALAWLRLAGRPAVEWAALSLRYATAPRRGHLALGRPPGVAQETDGRSCAATVLQLRPRAAATAWGAPAAARGRAGPSRTGAHRITFCSMRGGSGRTMLASELACLLASQPPEGRRGRLRVALLDLDAGSAAVALRLGLPAAPSVLDYAMADPDRRRVADFLARHASGARVLPGPARPVTEEWPLTAPLVREVLRELDMEDFDVVISDVPAQLTALTRAVVTSADDVFVVLSPTPAGVQDAYRTTEALRRVGLRHQLRYVVNHVRAGADLGQVLSDLRAQVIAEIPEDTAFVTAEHRHALVAGTGGAAAFSLHRFARRIRRELAAA